MNYNNKRGQAAMEFLMTYGWAILAAIVVIAVLAIYFRPSTIVSNSGVISAPWYMNAFNIKGVGAAGAETGGVTFEMKNNAGEDLVVSSVNVINAKLDGADITCTKEVVSATVAAGDLSAAINVDCGIGAAQAGGTFSGEVILEYTKVGGTVALSSSGSVAGKVIE